MRFAINTPNFDVYSDPRLVGELAREAEAAGWDGYFLWDHIGADWPSAIADPWIQLAVMATNTERIKLGALVTPIPRRRPPKLARETVTLDHLSAGRLVFGAGIGSDSGREYSCYGESTDDKLHGEMLDEGLEVLMGLWSGEDFSYTGKHYQINQARFLPRPLQQPRIPVWVAGVWPNKKPFRRAAQWDGICPLGRDGAMTPDDFRDMLAYIHQHRTLDTPLDVVRGGRAYEKSPEEAAEMLAAYEAAGVTWWMEGFDWNNNLDDVREIIKRGPPAPSGQTGL